ALPENFGAAIFMLADQPHVTGMLLDALIQRHRETLAPIVSPRVGERRANPALFDRTTWGELQQVSGDTGGRGLFQKYESQVAWVDWSPEILPDVDTPEDYRTLVQGGDGS
ncbi:MAG: NTP transferase domain-containing protein, partial [Chloroflexi bacterium]|nr:NTP transferase domain-containing protein [Chloroflexota bacterium]